MSSIADLIRGRNTPANNPTPEPPVNSSEELRRELRREKVLKMLKERPKIQRAFLTDTESDRHNVILALGIRNAGTCELLIPKSKYDPFTVLAIIQKSGIQ